MKHDLAKLTASLKAGGGPQMLLVFGDDLLVPTACKEIIDVLVPEGQRAFNLERLDGRTASWDDVETGLLTPPLFPGKKVLWVERAPYFLSREQNSELGENVLQFWSDGKQEDAAKLLIEILALEGWTAEQWEQLDPKAAGSVIRILASSAPEARRETEALIDYCKKNGIGFAGRQSGHDHRLPEWLDRGLPQWVFLLLTAIQVDRRTRLYKRLEESGLTLNLAVARDKTGRMNRETVVEFIGACLRDAGKTVDVQVREMILSRAPDDLRGLEQELDKLVLFVGERPVIRSQDVEAVVADHGQGWIFDLTRSIAERDAVSSLSHLARLIAQGEHPLKLLSVLAGEIRRLVAARQLLDTDLRGKWRRGMSYAQFQQQIVERDGPLLSRNGYADYFCLQRAAGFSLRSLLAHVRAIHDADFRVKSSGSQPRLILEKLIVDMCVRSSA